MLKIYANFPVKWIILAYIHALFLEFLSIIVSPLNRGENILGILVIMCSFLIKIAQDKNV